VVAYFNNDHTQADLVFITNDGLLRKAATERLEVNPRVRIFDDADAFFGDLRLTQENQTLQFDAAVKKNANALFATLADAAIARAKAEHQPDTAVPEPTPGFSYTATETAGTWKVVSRASFVGRKDDRWLWTNRLNYERSFNVQTAKVTQGVPSITGSLVSSGLIQAFDTDSVVISNMNRYVGLAGGGETWKGSLLKLPSSLGADLLYQMSFEVEWSCLAKEDGSLSDGRIDKVNVESHRAFRAPQ
jgi:hypothetical protein